jgi:hypothetical protein
METLQSAVRPIHGALLAGLLLGTVGAISGLERGMSQSSLAGGGDRQAVRSTAQFEDRYDGFVAGVGALVGIGFGGLAGSLAVMLLGSLLGPRGRTIALRLAGILGGMLLGLMVAAAVARERFAILTVGADWSSSHSSLGSDVALGALLTGAAVGAIFGFLTSRGMVRG